MIYKLRPIAKQNSDPVYGLTVPKEVSALFVGVSFKIETSGNSITYTSGAVQTITTEQVTNYKFEDVKCENSSP